LESLKGRDHSEDIGIDVRIEINLKEIGWESVEWTDLAQNRDRWRALVKTVMNLPVP
jgi:hypothetical protein